jgi:hypothetical protein
MATTISGSTITFTDGSTWGGANGTLTPANNAVRTDTAFNIGHIILSNCIFSGNAAGFMSGGTNAWALNASNQWYNGFVYGYGNGTPAANNVFAANDARHGSQSYFALSSGSNTLVGTWKNRGMAMGAGINQTNGYFVLQERVA